MRASIAKPHMECGSHAPAFQTAPWPTIKKKAAQENSPCGPFLLQILPAYCLLGLLASGLDSPLGSGLLAAGCFASPCEPACACETSSIRVPLSR